MVINPRGRRDRGRGWSEKLNPQPPVDWGQAEISALYLSQLFSQFSAHSARDEHQWQGSGGPVPAQAGGAVDGSADKGLSLNEKTNSISE